MMLMMTTFAASSVTGMQPLSSGLSQEAIEYSLREHFDHFVERFDKVYEDAVHREKALFTWVENLEKIVQKNAKLAAAGEDQVHGITKFMDMTEEEFRTTMLPAPRDLNSLPSPKKATVAVPTKDAANVKKHDWRESGVITPVKDQGRCGSCWAHSAVETLESAYAMAGHKLTSLSVQQVVSCDKGNGDMGCSGGMYTTAWESYIETSHGLTTEKEYPYDNATASGSASACDKDKEDDVVSGTAPNNYTYATTPCEKYFCKHQDEDTLKANLLSYGPISVACDASEWSMYHGGVVTSSTCKNSGVKLDHAIQLVGFNEDADTPYWIVRNSWNTNWGEEGYIYLKMGENTCGIADMPAMVTIDDVKA
jgi:C1A family cysteine protease